MPSSDIPVVIPYIRPSWRRRFAVLFTVGLSRFEMPVTQGAEQYQRAELMLVLPKNWPPPKEALKDKRWAWPIQWLLKIAAYPVLNDTWLGAPLTVLVEEEPPKPLGPGTRFTAWLLAAGEEEKRIIACRDGSRIQIYSLCPLYTEEYLFERQNGMSALLSQMERYGFPECIDVNRVNVVTGR